MFTSYLLVALAQSINRNPDQTSHLVTVEKKIEFRSPSPLQLTGSREIPLPPTSKTASNINQHTIKSNKVTLGSKNTTADKFLTLLPCFCLDKRISKIKG